MPEKKAAHFGDSILAVLFIFSRNLPGINRKKNCSRNLQLSLVQVHTNAITKRIIQDQQVKGGQRNTEE